METLCLLIPDATEWDDRIIFPNDQQSYKILGPGHFRDVLERMQLNYPGASFADVRQLRDAVGNAHWEIVKIYH